MKNSLIWRFILIAAVLLGWTLSFFPLQDKDFFLTFEELAKPKVEEYNNNLAKAQTELDSLQQKLADMPEDGAERAALQTQIDELVTAVAVDQKLLDDYHKLLAESREMVAEDNDINAPSIAMKLAAQGSENEPGILLHNYVEVPTIAGATNSTVLSRVRRAASSKLSLGLDLMGGTEFVVGFDPDAVPSDRSVETVRDQIIEILRNRVDSMGVVEPEIKAMGDTSVSVRMPSVSEDRKAEIRQTIKQPAELTFHLVHPDNDKIVAEYEKFLAGTKSAFELDPKWKHAVMIEEQPDGSIKEEHLFIEKRPTRIRGRNVRTATASVDSMGNFEVLLSFDGQGTEAFATVTSENVKRQLAIVLDGTVYSAPVIREAITGGSASISGNFGPEEATRLASVISSGNLPVQINIDSEFGTDPTLGADSIRSGTTAALVGLVLVVLFMAGYYRVAGIVAVIALAANLLLVLGTLALLHATLTLPGIAGIVLTIGMAVDANVLIFERIREELRNGKSIGNAIKAGYRRAFLTIFDANLTTFITALILLRFGTGPIRGFAVTLAIGIVASMFSALFMTRAAFDLLIHLGWLKKLSMAAFVREDTHIPFLKVKNIALIGSAVLVVVSLGWAGYRGHDALSVDFAGGTVLTYRVTADQTPDVGAVRDVMAEQGYQDCSITYKYTSQKETRLLEIVLPEQSTNEIGFNTDDIQTHLADAFDDATFKLSETTSVGSLIGSALQKKAIWAGVFAALAIMIYISFRFELAYAVASVIALIHDVIIAAGIYLLCGRQLSLPVVAALLTIMGYSLNDTIVLFDRIREDLSLLKSKSYRDIIDISINQTLSRTLLTSLTTLLVVVCLFLFGGGAINDFALVMLVGIIVGTYSSIFIASAIIASWHRPDRHDAKAA